MGLLKRSTAAWNILVLKVYNSGQSRPRLTDEVLAHSVHEYMFCSFHCEKPKHNGHLIIKQNKNHGMKPGRRRLLFPFSECDKRNARSLHEGQKIKSQYELSKSSVYCA